MRNLLKRILIVSLDASVILGCYIIDRPNVSVKGSAIAQETNNAKKEKHKSDKNKDQTKPVEATENTEVASFIATTEYNNTIDTTETTTEEENKSNESPITLHLAQGVVGSLAKKEYKGAYVYEKPNTYSGEIARLHYNCCMEIDDENSTDKWVALKISKDGSLGYVKKSEIKEVNLSVGGEKYDEIRNGIVKEAIDHLGQDYSVKGKTLDKTNCNTFAQLLYRNHGINIPNSPNAQKKAATIIPETEALPGDLIYYHANGGSGHIGIYLADGYIINSAGHDGKEYPAGGVRICRINYHDREEYEVCRMF